jgi:hypothetical protein
MKTQVELEHRESMEREEEYEREKLNQEIEKIKKEGIEINIKQYKTLRFLVYSLLKSNRINSLIVIGKRGIGKTYNIIKELERHKQKYELTKGHITPLILYKTLYEHKDDNTILIFDDMPNLLKNDECLSILLSAMDYDYRTVKWLSSAKLDIPSEFIYNGKLILCLNEIQENKEFVEAFKDRAYYYELNIDIKTLFKVMYTIAKKKEIPYEVVDYLKEIYKPYMKNFSLRLLEKAYEFYRNDVKYTNWKKMLLEIIEQDEIMRIISECEENNGTTKDAIEEFKRMTGLSRATFFRYKRKMEQFKGYDTIETKVTIKNR